MSAHGLKRDFETSADDFDFFAALRLIECWNMQQPRIGSGTKASDDPVRFGQEPELLFRGTSLAGYWPGDGATGKPRLAVNFMGLFGPHGALPLHLTEFARERIRHQHDSTIAGFADIFHHRMISLFYRAWAAARPTVNYDRPESDLFSFYVGSLLGVSGTAFQERDDLADRAKLFYAGHFAGQTKHPEGLRAIITDILQLPVRIQEFVGEWMAIQQTEQTRLGISAELATLGQSALLGASVWGCQHKFRVRLGSMTLSQYLGLLPGGTGLPQLVAIVRNYIGDEMVWDAQLSLEFQEVPEEIVLGKAGDADIRHLDGNAQLGWSMWLGPRHTKNDADDLRLNPFIKLATV